MQVWNVLHGARWKYRTQKIVTKSPSGRHRTSLSGYIFATKAHIDNQNKLAKQQYLLHMFSQYGELRPTSGWDRFVSLGIPANFNGFRVLAALLHGTRVLGVSQTLRRWTEGATYIPHGDHHVGHLSTFLVVSIFSCLQLMESIHSGDPIPGYIGASETSLEVLLGWDHGTRLSHSPVQ